MVLLIVNYDGVWEDVEFNPKSVFFLAVTPNDTLKTLADKICVRFGLNRDAVDMKFSTLLSGTVVEMSLDADFQIFISHNKHNPKCYVSVLHKHVPGHLAQVLNQNEESTVKPSVYPNQPNGSPIHITTPFSTVYESVTRQINKKAKYTVTPIGCSPVTVISDSGRRKKIPNRCPVDESLSHIAMKRLFFEDIPLDIGSNRLSSGTHRMGVNDSVHRPKSNAKVVQSDSKHSTNYNVQCTNVHTGEDDAGGCGTHCSASTVPITEQETHRHPLKPHHIHGDTDREVHPLPVPNTTNISVSCITNNLPDDDLDNTTYVHTPPDLADHNPSRHKVQGFDHVCFEDVNECSAFRSDPGNTSIHKGKIFKHKDQMKKELGVYAMKNHFWYRVKRSTTTRYEASCRYLNCQWLVRAVKKRHGTYWYVIVYRDTHTCKVKNYGCEFTQVSAYIVGELYAQRFADPGCKIRANDIISEMGSQHGVHLLYNKANRARLHALKIQFGDPLQSFQTLPAYFYMLKQCNPGTLTNIVTDSKDRFKYGFMALGVCLQGFSRVIRPVIAIDATHLTGSVKGVLLTASAKDGNEQAYPLAFGFAPSECKGSWTWFLSELKKGIGSPQDLVIVSDRHRGIISARIKVFPDAHHAFCVFHIAQKFRRSSKNRCMPRELFYKACSKYRRDDCDRYLEQLAACNQRYYNDVMEIGLDKITRAYCPKNRYRMMSTQLAECMNSVLVDLRKLPIAALAEQIRDMMQKWFHKRRTFANRLRTDLTPEADNHIHTGVEASYKCIIQPISYHRYNVTENQNNSIVDIQAKTCACRGWDLEKLPCHHALACARYASEVYCRKFVSDHIYYQCLTSLHLILMNRYASIPVPEMCSEYYTSDTLRQAYRGEINPLPHAQNWVVPDQVRNLLVLPWKVRVLPGRPKKSRYRSCVEKAKQKNCSNCGLKGHNKRSCRKPASDGANKTKHPRSCSVCHKQGHNRQTCPDRPSTDLTCEASAYTDTGTDTDTDTDTDS